MLKKSIFWLFCFTLFLTFFFYLPVFSRHRVWCYLKSKYNGQIIALERSDESDKRVLVCTDMSSTVNNNSNYNHDQILITYSYTESVESFSQNINFHSSCEYSHPSYKSRDILGKSLDPVNQVTLETSHIMDIPPISFLPNYRNPCFFRKGAGETQLRQVLLLISYI